MSADFTPEEVALRQSIVDNLTDLVKRREQMKANKQTTEAIKQIAVGIAQRKY